MAPVDLSKWQWYSRANMLLPLSHFLDKHVADQNRIEKVSLAMVFRDLLQTHILDSITEWAPFERHLRSCIWVESAPAFPGFSQSMLAALYSVSLAFASGLPCLFYFNSFTPEPGLDQPPTRRKLVMDMVGSIIVQLVLLLPEQVYAPVNLSAKRFAALINPSVDDYMALSLLRDIRSLVVQNQYVIIEGIDRIDAVKNGNHSRLLKQVLLEFTTNMPLLVSGWRLGDPVRFRMIRSCLTSNGYSEALAQMDTFNQLVKIMEEPPPTPQRPCLVLTSTYRQTSDLKHGGDLYSP
ncbi:hypothetical protein F4811DRAFT_401865 [Daldinia bambusicola]|nr:hypothetical protein F4811DRAFT_401865 [Daldinia bambusicola]